MWKYNQYRRAFEIVYISVFFGAEYLKPGWLAVHLSSDQPCISQCSGVMCGLCCLIEQHWSSVCCSFPAAAFNHKELMLLFLWRVTPFLVLLIPFPPAFFGTFLYENTCCYYIFTVSLFTGHYPSTEHIWVSFILGRKKLSLAYGTWSCLVSDLTPHLREWSVPIVPSVSLPVHTLTVCALAEIPHELQIDSLFDLSLFLSACLLSCSTSWPSGSL